MKKETLLAGYGRVCITPKEPTLLIGYPHIDRYHQDVKDDIYVSCVAFRDVEGSTALIYTIDLLQIAASHCTTIRKAAEEKLGVPYGNIILNSTHSHASIAINIDTLTPACIEAAKEALDDLSECRMYTAVRETYGLNFCRRFLTKEGELFEYSTRPVIWSFETEADHNAYLLKLERKGKKDIVMANWAAHNDTIYGCEGKKYTISADYVGAARTAFEKEHDAYLSIQMGACGDVNPINTPFPFYSFGGTDKYGYILAREFTEGLRNAKELEAGRIKAASVTFNARIDHSRDGEVELCKKISTMYYEGNTAEANELAKNAGFTSGVLEADALIRKSEMPESIPMELSVLAVGNVAFAVSPSEAFNDTGMQIREASKFDFTFICAYSNGMYGYIPTIKGFSKNGYEKVTCIYRPGVAEESVEEYKKLLDKLYE